jgi:hypothetical protein
LTDRRGQLLKDLEPLSDQVNKPLEIPEETIVATIPNPSPMKSLHKFVLHGKAASTGCIVLGWERDELFDDPFYKLLPEFKVPVFMDKGKWYIQLPDYVYTFYMLNFVDEKKLEISWSWAGGTGVILMHLLRV